MNKLKLLMALTIVMMSAMNTKAQNQRMMDFQNEFSKYQTQYRDQMHSGKHKDALAPLASCIAMLDTTTIFKVAPIPEGAILEQKGLLYYDQACCYAIVGQKKQALAALGQSVELGYKDYNNMVNDNDLVSLRKDKKYQALLAQVKDRQPLNVLKKSAPYAKDDAKVEFRYQPKISNNLCKVRDYFKLDSVAGQGDELSKIINLLHFAHDNIRHDGSNQAFAELDAIDLYNYYKATGKGVNCRQLAISLCEMYLSMGIPARYVTCMPADSLDYECHVINTVWSSQLQKWLYIDPTMDAWVTDENGTLLSIAEVRERLINNQPLVLCETANWNHESQQTKEYYLETYMAKNLYYFVCKKLNRFNPESVYRDNDPEGDVRLIPVGFVNNNWKCDTTTDPEVFWAKPE
ncbi:transglutaminase-like domain-containing protein [Prevotella sp. MA2016]|uniref:transglutaminase-like domain-containing protein n=1 Tax=Prevotella sp. MA2016 TaxID=1408310 RepID=UPI00056991C3|nr:transglutaminase-like domain-containing protein [Prevotella sp. MA2016]